MHMQVMVQADYKEQEMEEMRIKDMKSTKIIQIKYLKMKTFIVIVGFSLVRNNLVNGYSSLMNF